MKITPHRPDNHQVYKNPFKENNIYPFNKIGRVGCDKDTAEIRFRLGEEDSNLDVSGFPIDWSNLDIYTYIPKFYSKRTWTGETVKDEISSEIPTDKGHDGWEIHPAFLREDGTVRPYILIGCFDGTEVGGQLRSIPSLQKPLVSITISTALSKARQGRNNKFTIGCPQMLTVMQILCKVAFQTLNLQQYIGNGWTNKSEAQTVGTTMSLGNRTGYVGVNGDQISVFGVEDFYGGVWQFITGYITRDDGIYITHDPSKFGGAYSSYDKIANSPQLTGQNGYVKKILKIDNAKHKYMNIPKEIGGSDSTYYCDYHWSHEASEENICLFGAYWDGGASAGAFYLDLSTVASGSWTHIGARLCYLP